MDNQGNMYSEESQAADKFKGHVLKAFLKIFAKGSSIVIGSVVLYALFAYVYPSPQEKALAYKLKHSEVEISALGEQVSNLNVVLNNLRERDRHVYELLVGQAPLDDNVWDGGIGGHALNGSGNREITNLKNDLAQVERKLVLQSKYLDKIEMASEEKENYLASLPSIKPIKLGKSDRYLSLLSGYGMRKHPVHKVRKMHKGIDFPGPVGATIVATGKGKVIEVKKIRTGYGRSVKIDHGYGYVTLYAHLNKVHVKKGQEVVRGEQIGTMGKSGTVTASHLHYEVRKNGQAINPINFCMDGLNPSEFQSLIEYASSPNQISLD